MIDVVALSNRYGELLKQQRAATTPEQILAIKVEMFEIEMATRWSSIDFLIATGT